MKTREKEILDYHSEIDKSNLADEIITGLNSEKRYISPKFFYDAVGSELFEQITSLNEYYPTRTEKSILNTVLNKLRPNYSELSLIELGSGDPSKIRLLLDQIPKEYLPLTTYLSVDISKTAIEESISFLSERYPKLIRRGIIADFMNHELQVPANGENIICFLGSTIGNFKPEDINEFMQSFSSQMKSNDSFLVGFDMIKDKELLEDAYNDKAGVTARFNKNILNVVNSHVGSNINPDDFTHKAFFNEEQSRIEMHLQANTQVEITPLNTEVPIIIKSGESIHTENSYKFSNDRITEIGFSAGLKVENIFTDSNKWFSLVQYKSNP